MSKSSTQVEPPYRESQSVSHPPIITYPEFLTNPPPAPLLTTSRILNVLYATSFSTAALYGAFEYVVSPMVEKLVECRHELFNTTLAKLEILSKNLEGVVSEIPPLRISHSLIDYDDMHSERDDDPMELFHRDIGIQTSPPNSPKLKSSRLAHEQLTNQSDFLDSLSRKLREMTSLIAEEKREEIDLETTVTEFRKYLNEKAYPQCPGNNYEGILRSSGAFGGYNRSKSTSGVNGEEGEIVKIKKEIKGMKGLLLSARNFPGVRSGTIPK